MRFLYLSKIDGEWTVLTKDGVVLTTQVEPTTTPRIRFHPKSTVEFIDIEWLIEEARDAVNAEATAPGTEVSD